MHIHTLIRCLRLLVPLTLLSSSLAAQSFAPADTARELSLGGMDKSLSGLYVRHQGQYVPVDVPRQARGKPLVIGSGAVELFTAKAGGNAAAYTSLGSWDWPSGVKHAWLLLRPKSGGGLEGVLLSDDLETFGRQTVRVINTTPSRSAVKLRSESLVLTPHEFKVVPVVPDARRRVSCVVGIEGRDGGLVGGPQEDLFITPNYRLTLFVNAGNAENLVNVVSDYMPVNPPRMVGSRQ